MHAVFGDMEAEMEPNTKLRVDVEAANALVTWSALFADEVCEGAKRIANQSTNPTLVTLSHYRQAAQAALELLAASIRDGDTLNAEAKVA